MHVVKEEYAKRCTDSQICLSALKGESFELGLKDIQMPVLNAGRRLQTSATRSGGGRWHGGHRAGPPVAREATRSAVCSGGVYGHLAKPLRTGGLAG